MVFEREIVRILDEHCVACHQEGGAAVPLVTYEETWLAREAILRSVLSGQMPPWSAVPGYGEFLNDNGLTVREKQFVVSWVEGLGPRNAGEVFLNVRDPTEAREVIGATPGEPERWALGQPDLVLDLSEGRVGADDGQWARIIVPTGLAEAPTIQAIEYRPGDRSAIRAANFFLESTGQWLGSWTPWHGYLELPTGVALTLGQGDEIAAEIRYEAPGRTFDHGVLGLYFADGLPAGTSPLPDLVLEAFGQIPASTADHLFQAEATMEVQGHVLALLPRFEPGIRSLEVSVRRLDGGTEILLYAQDVPTDWPTPYITRRPVVIPAGGVLRATAHFDNLSDVPASGGFSLRVSMY